MRVKEVRLDGSPGRRWVIRRSRAGEGPTRRRPATSHAELERIKTIRDRATKTSKKTTGKKGRTKAGDATHVKAECALRDQASST